jgi:predicted nuclease of restriction endonuclease-like (RecB) superfamily
MDADSAHSIHIIEDPDAFGENLVFKNADDADMWLQKNAKIGWCTRIIDTNAKIGWCTRIIDTDE